MSQTAVLEWTVPADVQAFAEEQGVAPYLPAVLEATQRVFPTARKRDVHVMEDPEIADERHIVIELDVPMSVEESLLAQRRWNEVTLQYCPTALICTFCLSIELVD